MASYDTYSHGATRGPQIDAQLAQPNTVNNGNPGGIYNTDRASQDRAGARNRQNTNRVNRTIPSWLRRNDQIDYMGQNPNLGRYVAPQVDQNGNPVARDQGPYAYNIPNSYGQPFGYNTSGMGSVFNPFSMFNSFQLNNAGAGGPGVGQGGGLGAFSSMLSNSMRRQPPGNHEYDFQPQRMAPSKPMPIAQGNTDRAPQPYVPQQNLTLPFIPDQYGPLGY